MQSACRSASARHFPEVTCNGTDCALGYKKLDLADAAIGTTESSEGRRITMGYRVFRDSRGVEWQAWDVVPQLTERREIERRMARKPVDHPDRRRDSDRRIRGGRRPGLTAGLDNGWLCFEGSAEKRRLSPIPLDWQRCTEAQLEQ